jgi:DNA mismatch repair protein MutL
MKYDQRGNTIVQETVAIATGTQVTVKNLFGQYPLRRRAMLPKEQQLKEVAETIHHLALTHPQVTWQVWQNGKNWFNLSPSNHADGILAQIIRLVRLEDLRQTSQAVTTPNLLPGRIDLTLGLPDRCHRSRPDWLKIAVNGRLVHIESLEEIVTKTLSRSLPKDRYPICFIHCQIPYSEIDWNRHPAKSQIYLQDLSFWQEELKSALENSLGLSQIEQLDSRPLQKIVKIAEKSASYQVNAQSGKDLLELKAIAQIHQTYIIAEHPTGIWLIEQHVAHERIIYERLKEHWQMRDLAQSILLQDLSPSQLEQLQNIGITIEPFGENVWAVRTIPEILPDDCRQTLLELSIGANLDVAQVAVACRSATRNGTTLNLEQMQLLLDQWKRTLNPRTCPHGRPIYLPLEESSLSRFFRRNWLIDKSY